MLGAFNAESFVFNTGFYPSSLSLSVARHHCLIQNRAVAKSHSAFTSFIFRAISLPALPYFTASLARMPEASFLRRGSISAADPVSHARLPLLFRPHPQETSHRSASLLSDCQSLYYITQLSGLWEPQLRALLLWALQPSGLREWEQVQPWELRPGC